MNHLNRDERKWITATEYVDVETGEIITKSQMEREYYLTGKTTSSYDENSKYRIRKYTKECRRNNQTRIW